MSVEDALAHDPKVTRLVELAREQLQGHPPRREQASFDRLEIRLGQQVARRARVRSLAFASFAGACAVAACVALWLTLRTSSLTYEVENGSFAENGALLGSTGTRIRFSDGSEVSLKPGAETRIADLEPRGGRVRVENGSAWVAIAKKPGAAWTVEAGPYTVKVTGTSFDVSWSKAQQRFELAMKTGSVIVSGPLIAAPLSLRAGQHLTGGVAEGRLTVHHGEPQVAEPAQGGAQASPEPSLVGAPPVPSAKVVDAGRAETKSAITWSQQVAQGDFAAVIAQAEQRGIERTLASASIQDLSALADAARYGRRHTIARRALITERQRFPGSRPAREAAFFLGRLSEEDGSSALDWYERYLSENPQGAYVPQALGRKMMLIYQQGRARAARPIAEQYVERYPNGPYAAAARKIVAETARTLSSDPRGSPETTPTPP